MLLMSPEFKRQYKESHYFVFVILKGVQKRNSMGKREHMYLKQNIIGFYTLNIVIPTLVFRSYIQNIKTNTECFKM